MYETTESAWVLAELYLITGNETYLNSSEAAGRYMLSRQFIGPEWIGTPVFGALPYEWNETHYSTSVSTNHAGYTILAWSQLYQITRNPQYLDAAKTYANWLLSFQITKPETNWGNHTYANDSMALGGFYYGYNTQKREFGWRVAESLWSASYAIPALLMLYRITGNDNYRQAALFASDWLTRMRYPEASLNPLQALAIVKYPFSSWWGPYPQYYQPDIGQVDTAGIAAFVDQGRANETSIKTTRPTWFEQAFSVDFNEIDYEMASRGPTYMKMIWSWWPNVGFEPRYGGDIAFGAFAIDGYLAFNTTIDTATQVLREIDTLTGNSTRALPENASTSYNQAATLTATAAQAFSDGWFAIARAQANDAIRLANIALNYAEAITPFRLTNQLLIGLIAFVLVALVISNFYWYRRSIRRAHRTLPKRRRK
jgi:protein-S-isoprenylcysteine O-methyltransferase Ste14